MQAGLFVDEEDRGLVDGTSEPRLAEGDTGGQIEGQKGFFSAGIANKDGETGLGEKILDAPFEDRRILQGILSGVHDAMLAVTVFGFGRGVGDFGIHFVGVGEFFNGLTEGLGAGIAAADAHVGNGGVSLLPVFGQLGQRRRLVAEFDQLVKNERGFTIWNVGHETPHPRPLSRGAGEGSAGKGLVKHEKLGLWGSWGLCQASSGAGDLIIQTILEVSDFLFYRVKLLNFT